MDFESFIWSDNLPAYSTVDLDRAVLATDFYSDCGSNLIHFVKIIALGVPCSLDLTQEMSVTWENIGLQVEIVYSVSEKISVEVPTYTLCLGTESRLSYQFYHQVNSVNEILSWVSFDENSGMALVSPGIPEMIQFAGQTIEVSVSAKQTVYPYRQSFVDDYIEVHFGSMVPLICSEGEIPTPIISKQTIKLNADEVLVFEIEDLIDSGTMKLQLDE